MAVPPQDFSNPEVPTNSREFYMLYFQNMKKNDAAFADINRKIHDVLESQCEDREDIMAKFDTWDNWKKGHDAELKTNLETFAKHSVAIRIVSWVGSIFGAGFVAFIIALITGQFNVVKP